MNTQDAAACGDLWKQAGGGTPYYSRERYHELMREHGHLVPLGPGEKREPLPCGWPDRSSLDREADANSDLIEREWAQTILDQRDAALEAITRVRVMHARRTGAGGDYCLHDSRDWPCPTVVTLDGAP